MMQCGEDILRLLINTVRTAIGEQSFTDAHALQVELKMRRDLGGESYYIAKCDRTARREIVIHEFNGRNRLEICARHGLSRSQFYRMLKGG